MALLKKESAGKIATKQSINFAEIGKKQEKNYMMLIPVAAILLVVGFFVVKYAFLDRLNDVEKQENITNGMQKELDDANDMVDSFGTLAKDYAHYTYSGMSTEEITRSDRCDILELLDDIVRPRCHVNSWTLKGNTMTINVSAEDKNTISRVKQLLENSPLVQVCTLPDVTNPRRTTVGDVEKTETIGNLKIQFNTVDRSALLPIETEAETEAKTGEGVDQR